MCRPREPPAHARGNGLAGRSLTLPGKLPQPTSLSSLFSRRAPWSPKPTNKQTQQNGSEVPRMPSASGTASSGQDATVSRRTFLGVLDLGHGPSRSSSLDLFFKCRFKTCVDLPSA